MFDGMLLRWIWLATRVVRILTLPLRHPLTWIPFALLAISAALWGLEHLQRWWLGTAADAAPPWPLLGTANVLGVFALGVVAVAVAGARRRLVVAAFGEAGGDHAVFAQGLGGMVAANLAELRDLFQQFDENRARTGLAVETPAPAPALQDAVSSQATLGLGPFQVPIGFLLGLLGRLVRGPRISGQVVKDGAQRLITLELTGVARPRSWVIADPAAGDPAGHRPAQDVAQELACRIFAAMALPEEVHWRALQDFVGGLRAFRRAQHAPQERRRALREAERLLVAAVTTDDRLDVAWHNLGVVHDESGRREVAQAAFDRASRRRGGRWGYLFPMAWTHRVGAEQALAQGNLAVAGSLLREAADLSGQALDAARGAFQRASTVNLRGLVQLSQARIEDEPVTFIAAANSFRRAVRLAWLALCSAELRRGRDHGSRQQHEQARELAGACLRNISFVYAQVSAAPGVTPWIRRLAALRARRNLMLARTVTPAVTDIHVSLGALAIAAGRWRAAIAHCRDATVSTGGDADSRCLLAVAEARHERLEIAMRTCERAVDRIGELSDGSRARLLTALGTIRQRLGEVAGAVQPGGGVHRRGDVGLAHRLAGRRLNLLGPTLAQLRIWRAQAAAGAAPFAAWLDRVAAIEKRIADYPALRARLDELRQRGHAGRADLEALVAACQADGNPYEAGLATEQLARQLLNEGGFADAVPWIRTAIELFGKVHPEEVRRRGLHGLLAYTLRRQGLRTEALIAARAAVAQDPLGSYEYRQLGEAHLALRQIDAAEQAFAAALRWAPDDATLHHRLGQCVLERGREPGDRANRRRDLEGAIVHLQTALEIGTDDPVAGRDTEHLLARVLTASRRHAEAVAHLRVLERTAFNPVAVGLDLADCLLSTHAWVEAESRFRRLAATLEPRTAAEANERVDGGTEDDLHRGIAAAYAHLGIASALDSRGIAAAEALAEVTAAEQCVRDIEDAALRQHWSGRCAFFRGRILAGDGKLDAARLQLLEALRGDPQPEVFVLLAQTLARQAAALAAGAEREACFGRAREHLTEARRLDTDGAIETELEAARVLLDSLEPRVPAAAAPAATASA